jgi:UDP-N-acetylglucosamine 2-epimerase (non-hydrolysing)
LRYRITTIIGTRPEAIKMAPVVLALRNSGLFRTDLIATGQHLELFDEALRPFALKPDHRLDFTLKGCTPEIMAEAIGTSLIPLLEMLAPDLVLVQGDTSSAFAAACTADSLGIPIGHVEAGLRSHDLDRPWPEEGNRIAIDRISTLLFAPSPGAMANIRTDPRIKGAAHLTGNSGIDALCLLRPRAGPRPRDSGQTPILVTIHRRETIGAQHRAICSALRDIAARGDVSITIPLHPNPEVRNVISAELAGHAGIRLVEPLSYPEMIAHMAAAHLILSDSGGVQEEAPALGVPLLILREVTERPEAIACGGARLTGTDPEAILMETERLLDDPDAHRTMARPRFPFGRGDASSRIVTVIENYFGAQNVT